MFNLRIISDNAADRATTVASTTAGSLVAANLRTDIKTEVWRSTATSATLTTTWAASEIVGCVALPFTNLTPTATIRVRGYTEAADGVAAFDTGAKFACAYAPLGLWDWGVLPLGVNSYVPGGVNTFAQGAGSYGCLWFDLAPVKKLVIDLVDTYSLDGYIEVARLVTGTYWSPDANADYGAAVTAQDTSKQYRTDAGDLMTDHGTRNRKLSINMSKLSASERAGLWRVLRGSGLSRPVFFSLYPESDDTELEQSHQIYGKLLTMQAVSTPSFNNYAAPLEIEEI